MKIPNIDWLTFALICSSLTMARCFLLGEPQIMSVAGMIALSTLGLRDRLDRIEALARKDLENDG